MAPAWGASIHGKQAQARAASQAAALSAYYTRAMETHSLHVNVPPALRGLRPLSDGTLPKTAFVDYLRWRMDLNPKRFTAYHPRVAAMMLRDNQARQAEALPPITEAPAAPQPQVPLPPATVDRPTASATPSIVPPSIPPRLVVPPEVPPVAQVTITPPPVPEPSSALIMLTLFGGAAWVRDHRRRPS